MDKFNFTATQARQTHRQFIGPDLLPDQRQICTDWQAACTLQETFPNLIPDRPYCADALRGGLKIREKKLALEHRHIQLNGPATFRWMPHDIDRADAYFAHRDANLPDPNFIAINPKNGHGHCAILLAVPVARHSASRIGPLRFYGAVERGIARRLGADRHYVGLVTKNPTHEHWRVEWRRDEPYSLPELADWLFFEDMRPDPGIETTFGAGRNVTVFDELRLIAYREVLSFKRAGSIAAWFDRCLRLAIGINQQFPLMLRLSEVRAIAKSVSQWTWLHFSEQKLSQRQAQRGKVRAAQMWAGHVPDQTTKPWEINGISRRTHYRRKTTGTLAISDNSPSSGAAVSPPVGPLAKGHPVDDGRTSVSKRDRFLTLKQTVKVEMEIRLLRRQITEAEAMVQAYMASLEPDRKGASQ